MTTSQTTSLISERIVGGLEMMEEQRGNPTPPPQECIVIHRPESPPTGRWNNLEQLWSF